ncbi:MAG: excinuclease ABC subunit UvrC [Firmicutes bacterium]|nr:excinuclease ABC subunit UvrC [Candidatus Caballimonas caccae]
MSVIADKVKLLPDKPGVYVMLNSEGQVIYVGKAKILKNRVRQYFFNSVKNNKTMAMVSNIADFYYIITPSEIDALALENNLIKKYKPRYNILLKDDKTYPYIKVNLKETFPTFTVTRKIKKDGAKYFGPFMGGINVSSILETLNLAFNIRPCDKVLSREKKIKPCLNYHIKKCLAPCAGCITEEEYLERVSKAISFLSGEIDETENLLREKMISASEREEFELAIKYKENLLSLDKLKLKRLTSLNKFINADIIATANNGIYTAINILFVRNGRMLGGNNYYFEYSGEKDSDIIAEFITRFYKTGSFVPDEILTEVEIIDTNILEEYFEKQFSKKPDILCPIRGVKSQLIDMAKVNAEDYLTNTATKIKHKNDMTVKACEKLKEILHLSKFPYRMECFDISNISGVDSVGSMVVFINSEPSFDSYRRFKIKTVVGPDDFKSHQEMMERRLDRLETDSDKFPKPDLIIIDGGKGQLSSVKEIFDKHNITDIDLISLAEKNEEVYTIYSNEPIIIDKHDYSLKLLQRIRDEAHRFAITYHRSIHSKKMLSSVLDNVYGLGKVKKQKLLEKFKDISGIISCTKEELMSIDGIGFALADEILKTLSKEGLK